MRGTNNASIKNQTDSVIIVTSELTNCKLVCQAIFREVPPFNRLFVILARYIVRVSPRDFSAINALDADVLVGNTYFP